MSETHSNHYSPEFTNKPWADGKGRIVCLRRITGSKRIITTNSGPKKWGAELHLWSQAIENDLAKFEGKIAPIYQKLLVGSALVPRERLLWSQWILCQFARTPTFMLELAGLDEDILSALPDFSGEFSGVGTDTKIAAAISNIQSFQVSLQLIPFIILRDWIVLRPAPGEFFIKGDVPVVMRGALADDDAKIVYPLSPTRCFVATVLKNFPPQQYQGECQLRTGMTSQYIRLVAACAEREVICHPNHSSSELERLLAGILGTSSRCFNVSSIPNW